MTKILLVTGPQGSEKSTIAEAIAAGLNQTTRLRAAVIDDDICCHPGNASALRTRHWQCTHLVVVVDSTHGDTAAELLPGMEPHDLVITLSRP